MNQENSPLNAPMICGRFLLVVCASDSPRLVNLDAVQQVETIAHGSTLLSFTFGGTLFVRHSVEDICRCIAAASAGKAVAS